MKDYLMKVTTNSPRRSQYNGLLISPATGTAVPASAVTISSTTVPVKGSLGKSINSHHHLTPTYVKSTGASFSSLKRVKNVPLYATSYIKSSPSSTMDNRSIYTTLGRNLPAPAIPSTATTSQPGQYRSPSRILLESGYLTLPHHHQHHHQQQQQQQHQGRDHVYENLYSSPNNNTSSALVDVTDGIASSSPPSAVTKGKYMNNLRSSVQLKRSSHATPCTNCSKADSPSIATTSSSLDRKVYKYKLKDRKDTKCHLCGDNDKNKQSGNQVNLNQQVIWIKDDASKHENSSKQCSSECKRKKKKKRSLFFGESFDQQKRFQFIQSTLIICNVIALLVGIVGLIVAGFVDARPSLTSFGGQLTCASVYIILTSLTGLYGARRESISLLLVYGIMIVLSLFLRSVFYFIVSFMSSDASAIAASMIAAFLEVTLIFFAFALASEVRMKKLDKKNRKTANDGARVDEKDTAVSSSTVDTGDEGRGGSSEKKTAPKYSDRDIESSSPVASAETDSTTSNVDVSLFNGKDDVTNLFTISGSPLFSFSSTSPSLSNKASPVIGKVNLTGKARDGDEKKASPLTSVSPVNRFNRSPRTPLYSGYSFNGGINSTSISPPSSSRSPTDGKNNRPGAYF